MALTRVTVSTLIRNKRGLLCSYKYVACAPPKENLVFSYFAYNGLSTHRLSKNIELISDDKSIITKGQNRPLLIILSWLLCKRAHIMKFANFYMEQGFDVVTVSLTPWQLMWPAKGSRLIAADLLKFLNQNKNYDQILIHGFSVGGYVWGEVLDLIHEDKEKYNNIVKRVVGHIWDSAADVGEITIGAPKAVFPNNEVLQKMLKKYLEYHMKAFEKQSTQYYIRSSQLFHTNLVRSPALFLISDNDPIGSVSSNMRVRDSWESLGMQTYVKIFKNSPHVGHFRKYPKEYVAELYAFLDKLQLIQNEEKIKARL